MDLTQSTLPSHPIVALATPRAKSALAIIRITGAQCIELFAPFILHENAAHEYPVTKWPANQSRYCKLQHPKTKTLLDEAMVIIYKTPHSFTGQDSIEIIPHGSLISIEAILLALYECGFEEAEPGEFTKRAFLNGKLDLTQAEAIHSLIESYTTHTHAIALQQLSGTLSDYINTIKANLVTLSATCTVSLDYPDDEIQESTELDVNLIEKSIQKLDSVIQSYNLTRIHREGAVVIIAGKTNAGKSSLYNVLLKEHRAIISEEHGTTRDFLESHIVLNDIPLRLYDTAGLRHTSHSVEKEGIERSHQLIRSANLILYTIDGVCGLTDEDMIHLSFIISHIEDPDAQLILVWNKIDTHNRKTTPPTITISSQNTPTPCTVDTIVSVSAKTYSGIAALQDAIYKKLHAQTTPLRDDLTVITSLRQKQYLQECRESLAFVLEGVKTGQPLDMISLDLSSALRSLGHITGEVTNEEILNTVFSTFCVGK